jgi:hypothetical protein
MSEKSTRSTSSASPAPAAEPKAAVKVAPLASAAESSDAAVQNLLAERESYRLNDDADGMKDVDEQLAGLGYSAG